MTTTQTDTRYGTQEFYAKILRDSVGQNAELLSAASLGMIRVAVDELIQTDAGDELAGRRVRRILAAHDQVTAELTGYDRNSKPVSTPTFPMVAPGVRRNKETRVDIITLAFMGRPSGGYEVRVPDGNSYGYVSGGYQATLPEARKVASEYVQKILAAKEAR